jgi:hypothetical protein
MPASTTTGRSKDQSAPSTCEASIIQLDDPGILAASLGTSPGTDETPAAGRDGTQ